MSGIEGSFSCMIGDTHRLEVALAAGMKVGHCEDGDCCGHVGD